ncbi:MAG: DUF805 domain-containing protein [Gammaproteobacteria bacterium]|nr:MAG: DUF805 domain-containing protein [Gammaproteobacteria bacterium]
MTATNPYSPPVASVDTLNGGDVGFSEPKVWSAKGRIGRLRYLAYTMGGYLVFLLVISVTGGLAAGFNSSALGTGVLAISGLAYGVLAILAGIQRAHDMDWSGWAVFLVLIPLVNFIWIFKAGTDGANRYGAPPPPNTTGIKLLAFIFPIIVIIGVLAAIALPQYQQYVQRSKAAMQTH